MQQRAATRRDSPVAQAALATAASPAEVAQTREGPREMEQANARQLASIEAFTLENRRSGGHGSRAGNQLAAQQPTAAPVEPKLQPASQVRRQAQACCYTQARQLSSKLAARPATGSGHRRRVVCQFPSPWPDAPRRKIQTTIKPSAGKAVVQPTTSAGKTLYRVRVVGSAKPGRGGEGCAQLQAAHGVAKLWWQRISAGDAARLLAAPAQPLMFSHSSIQGHDHE